MAGRAKLYPPRPPVFFAQKTLEDEMLIPTRLFARRFGPALLACAALLPALATGCGARHVYSRPGYYAPAPVVVVHHYGSGYGYGGPNVVHVHHYGGGYGGGYGGRRTIVIHHYH